MCTHVRSAESVHTKYPMPKLVTGVSQFLKLTVKLTSRKKKRTQASKAVTAKLKRFS